MQGHFLILLQNQYLYYLELEFALVVFSISEGELDFGIGLKTIVGKDPNRKPQVFSEKADSRVVEEIESIFEITLESE